ncbi:glutamyl-tRNA reductase-binding protein, chloroplastic-like [Phragmites australis]|uniref:glutamyl-tRNA reductase-binding protein, chloroplastic-like n=1 Tax=Phragmites australis TaxID=29695 RepID=UPI002D77067A|nr:glutamyl-tRNA reductase-binding protein, chloroplastic-like [Phragmites australis]
MYFCTGLGKASTKPTWAFDYSASAPIYLLLSPVKNPQGISTSNSAMPSSSPSLLSSPLPSPATLFSKKPPSLRAERRAVRVVATAAAAAPVAAARAGPSAAEVARTVVELAPSGTLSVVGPDGWPLGVGARFVADAAGAPALCLAASGVAAPDARSSFHVEFRQSGARTPQCTMIGTLTKPSDESVLKKLSTRWQKKFGEEVDQHLLYLISVERILHMENFNEDGMWVVPSEYTGAEPDPLRNFAENIVEEMNSKHAEDVHRIYNIYVESDFQVADVKMIWVDRLGFDLHVHSGQGVFSVRIPFSREVSDEKGVKSSFNMMSHHAWEVEKSYSSPEFEKVQFLKKVR